LQLTFFVFKWQKQPSIETLRARIVHSLTKTREWINEKWSRIIKSQGMNTYFGNTFF